MALPRCRAASAPFFAAAARRTPSTSTSTTSLTATAATAAPLRVARLLSTSQNRYTQPNTYPSSSSSSESASTSSSAAAASASAKPVPRWAQTPPAMKAPWSVNTPKDEQNCVWLVNQDPEVLDNFYDRFLGPGGREMLPDELKWLAVTHKSFDYGRRGFNDKLELLGRLTLVMEATTEIISKPPRSRQKSPPSTTTANNNTSATGAIPSSSSSSSSSKPTDTAAAVLAAAAAAAPDSESALRVLAVDNLNKTDAGDLFPAHKVHLLAVKMGLLDVMRWKPRLTRELEASGVQTVTNGAIMAIIGAIVLQHGSVVASTIVRERVFQRIARL